jgi:hypothetical protein
MWRAAELFTLDTQASDSRLVEASWRTRSEPEASFISVAATHWEMVVTRQRGATQVTVRGPETRATIVPIPQDAEFFGIQFTLGTFMPGLPPGELVDRSVTLPLATSTSFRFDGSPWDVPGPDDVDDFVDGLVHAGLVVHDPVAAAAVADGVEAAVGEDVDGLSSRSVERRVARATGLTQGLIRRIRRAERAVELLSVGVSAPDAAHRAGYSDQSHLIRSLKRFVGQTPSQVAASAAGHA